MRGSGSAQVLICCLQDRLCLNVKTFGMQKTTALGDRSENCHNPKVVLTVAQELLEELLSVINSFPISQSFSHG